MSARKTQACAEAGLLLRTVEHWIEEQGIVKADTHTTIKQQVPVNQIIHSKVFSTIIQFVPASGMWAIVVHQPTLLSAGEFFVNTV